MKPLHDAFQQIFPDKLSEELKRNIDSMLQGQLEKMNLATREQLEIQEKILKRTRNKVDELEKTIELLEKQLADR